MLKNVFLIFFLFQFLFIISSKEVKLKILDKDIDIPLEGVMVKVGGVESPFYSDMEGLVTVSVGDEVERVIVTCILIGYETAKINVKDFDKEIVVQLLVEGFIAGEELVVEESYYTKEDKIGATKIVDKEELKANANRGIMEDVMSAVKALPGVSYSSGFYTSLSIRGSYPDEVSASFDGLSVRYPYFWGGSHSIFNPNIVEKVKFANGIFSAKYGMAISGILDVETKTADDGFKFNANLAMSAIDAYFEIPFKGLDMGLMIGARITYLELTIANAWKASGQYVPLAPYIRTGNVKWYWKPNERIEWYINGFFGADGIGSGAQYSLIPGIENYQFMQNQVYHALASTGLKVLPNDKIFLHFLVGYEFFKSDSIFELSEKGTKNYSDAFKSSLYYDASTDGDSFDLDFQSEGLNYNLIHTVQTKIESDFQLHDKVVLSAGTGIVYENIDIGAFSDNYQFVLKDNSVDPTIPILAYESVKFDIKYPNVNQIQPFAYLSFSFLPIPDKLEIELGCRADYVLYTFNNKVLHTYPVANPRFYIAYTPVRNLSWLDYFTISLGTGLYSKIPNVIYDIDEQKLNQFQIKQPQTLTSVLGVEFLFNYGIKLKIEGYYKFYFNRYYENSKYNTATKENDYFSHSDGYGHSAGADIVLEKKISRYIDGWISYSFNYARYLNPSTDDVPGNTNLSGEPTNIWYYHSHHRFHSMNIVVNIKPVNWLVITPSFGVHSGLPMKEFYGDKYRTGPESKGKPIEMYSQNQRYSDSLRTGVSLPLGIKITAQFYVPRNKVKFEFYFAIDNILGVPIDAANGVFLWVPDQKKQIDKYTGDIVNVPPAAYETFWPSFGIRISY